MKIVIDIEANRLVNPDKVWVIVCKDLATGDYHIFREVTDNVQEADRFREFASHVTLWIGHNWLGYDYPVLDRLCLCSIADVADVSIDTLIVSKLVDYSRGEGHSVEAYGKEFKLEKGEFSDWSKYSEDMERYCVRDVDITERIYRKYLRYISNIDHRASIRMEHEFQLVVNQLTVNGFAFNTARATKLLDSVSTSLDTLDREILEAFPPKEVVVRTFTPKATKHGTISKSSVPRSLWDRIHEFDIGVEYPVTKVEPFNPSSHKQLIEVLNEAGWAPVDKTTTHIKTERELNQLRYKTGKGDPVLKELEEKLVHLKVSGWKINEANLSTLPNSAPAPARLLAKRIMLESRRRTLTEWLELVQEDGRIHGDFYGIGAWTHRMAHQKPNTANIPNEFDTNNNVKLLGKEMRQLWYAPKNRLLVGNDAEGIQLRIFAHYIDDAEFTAALVTGKKEDKSDPHSLNQRILGKVCRSRQAAKRFIYALLLGAGIPKLAEILDCDETSAREALDRLLERYTGFQYLKQTIIPADAKRGWFVGIDGRRVAIPGEELGYRKHLAMSGYLQNGEAIVVKRAVIKTLEQIQRAEEWAEEFRKYLESTFLCNIVHDEVIFECPNDVRFGECLTEVFSKAIENVGRELNLKCPLAGDGHVGLNWYSIH